MLGLEGGIEGVLVAGTTGVLVAGTAGVLVAGTAGVLVAGGGLTGHPGSEKTRGADS